MAKPNVIKAIETFWCPSDYTMMGLWRKEPFCFNDDVHFRRYKISVEEIPEPLEVLQARVQKLWDECDNMHHWGLLKEAAKEVGIELSHTSKRKKK